MLQAIRQRLRKFPLSLQVAVVFALVVFAIYLLGTVVGPQPDLSDECVRRCLPRQGQLIADKEYPLSAKGQYRQLCECIPGSKADNAYLGQ